MHKKKALSEFLGIGTEDTEQADHNDSLLRACGGEYYVLTDEEADELAKEYIRDTAWAFNAWFILDHIEKDIPEEAIKKIQELYEGANEAIIAMIDDFDAFVDDAIGIDGRGHFLSSYDGAENEQGEYFIYRIS